MRVSWCCILLLGVLHAAAGAAALDAEAIVADNQAAVLVITGERPETGAVVQGSGVCVDRSGFVLATAHQVTGVASLEGRFHDGSRCTLEPVAVDAGLEYALLKASDPLPAAVTVGNADTLRAGSPLVSIAAPLNLEFSTVTGTVANALRTYAGIPVVQAAMTAAEGSSGGPVFDRTGALVGLISGTLEELPFVLINRINNAYPMLRAHGLLPAETVAPTGEMDDLPPIPAPDLSESERRAVEAYNAGVQAHSLERKIQAYHIATQLLPDFYEAWFNLGVATTAHGAHEKAENAYRHALALRADALEAHRNIGRLYLAEEDFTRAIAAFKEAVRLAPGDAQSYNDLGEAYRRANQLGDAARQFLKATEISPDYPPPHFNLGLVYAARGENAKAIKALETYLALQPAANDAGVVRQWLEQLRQD